MRYASTTNVIYLTAAKTYTPASIAAACPGAPIAKVSGSTWLLSADIVVEAGATLALHGSSAGGDTDTLRIRSRSSNARTEVQSITALGGTIDARNVTDRGHLLGSQVRQFARIDVLEARHSAGLGGDPARHLAEVGVGAQVDVAGGKGQLLRGALQVARAVELPGPLQGLRGIVRPGRRGPGEQGRAEQSGDE